MRFIGVDGYRWMIRGAAVGSPEQADAIADDVRKAMADTVVRRGETPMPVRYMLPLQLSESLVTRLRARAEQMVAEQAAGSPEAPQPPQPVARRSEQGSAMQQLRTITGG
jgi:Tfp pilus assembly protein FimV